MKDRIKSTLRLMSKEMATTAMTIVATLLELHKLLEEPQVEPQEALQEVQDQPAST